MNTSVLDGELEYDYYENYDYKYYYDEYDDVTNRIRLCSGPVEAYLDRSRMVWFSNVYCIPFIAVLGILCNVLNIVVLYRKKGRRVPSGTYLFVLALCDCIFLIFGTLEVTPITFDSLSQDPIFNKYYTFSIVYVRWISSTCFKAGVLLVIAFNVERYIWVCHPLQAERFCNRRIHCFVLMFIFIFSTIMGLQWPLCYEIDSCYNPAANQTFYLLRSTDNNALAVYNRVMNYVTMLLFNIVPIATVLVLNCIIILTLRRVLRRDLSIWSPYQEPTVGENGESLVRKRSSGSTAMTSSNIAWNANAILFAVVLMFMLCLGPQIPARILYAVYGPENVLVHQYMAISQQLIFLNASLNFCLYCLVSRKYRQLLKNTFKRICHKFKWKRQQQRTNSTKRNKVVKHGNRPLSEGIRHWITNRQNKHEVLKVVNDKIEDCERNGPKAPIVTFFVASPWHQATNDVRDVDEIIEHLNDERIQPIFV